MKLVVMTKSTYFVEEDKILTLLFEAGLEHLHISKTDESSLYLERLLMLIPTKYHKYITVYQHFDMAKKLSLAGIHLDNLEVEPPIGYKGQIGRTCKNSMLLKEMRKNSDYIILKNVYEDSSDATKTPVLSSMELTELKKQGRLGKHVYAMGGVTLECIPELKNYGFGGVVVGNDFWNKIDLRADTDFKGILNYFHQLRQATE